MERWHCVICGKDGDGSFPLEEHRRCEFVAEQLRVLQDKYQADHRDILANLEDVIINHPDQK